MYNKIKLLIIDDSPDDIYIIKELLKDVTQIIIQYEHEKSLSHTLKLLENQKFDCALLDLNLPDSSGIDTLKDILDQYPELPIVVLTVIDDEDTAIKSLHEGAQDYLVKGKINGEIILRSVQYAIERKKVENGLRESEKKYRNIVNTILEGLWVTDAEGKTTYINKQLAKMLGYTEEEILNKPFFDFVDKSLQSDAKQFFERRKKGIEDRYDFRFIKKDGSTLWVIVSASPIFDKKGKFAGAMGLLTDITDRKLIEQSLERSVQEWNSTFNAIADIICIIDLDTKITHCNSAATRLFKKSNEEIIGKTCREILNCPSERLKNCPLINMQKSHKRETLTLQIGGKWFHSAVDPIIDNKNNIVGGVHTISDITKYKLSQEALKESELALKKSQHIARIGHWIWHPKTNKLIWSDEMFNIFGITKDQFNNEFQSDLDKIIDKTFHPDDREKIRKSNEKIKLEGCTYPLEYRIIRPDGTIRIVRGEPGEKITNGSGDIVRLFGVVQDITEQKLVQDKLIEREELYRTITECSNDMIWLLDVEGNFTFINKRVEQISGYKLSQLKGTHFSLLIIKQDLQRIIDIFHSTLNGKPQQYEVTLISKYKKHITLAVNTAPIYSKGKIIGTISSGRDITETVKIARDLKILNKKLATSNKELQDFAYIASHDLQEPLRTIYGFIELLSENYKDKLGPEADEYIEFITTGSKRMQDMINDLLAISRVTRGKKFLPTDIENILDTVFKNLHLLINNNQAIITHDPMPTIMADDTQIVQLFQNLIDNAIKFRREETPKIHISSKKQNGEYIFSVKDNGIGIDKKQFKKLFIIFQRLHSREEYPGTGIGLAMCKKIVEHHGGKIWVESEVGIGSTFYFTIPLGPNNNSI